ncbi:MAG: VTT domain-containing protein, partial [Traorella sp.]
TCIGGHIGYELSARYGRKIVLKFVGEESIEKGIMEFQRLGYLFIVIGSISPFPDFILAYVAGLTKMNRLYFMLIDGGCRFIRSLILVYFSTLLNEFLHLDKYITIISILILVYFIMKMFFHKNK